MTVEDLRQSPMMTNMLDALDNGEDIGHYGRLVFAMIARHFVSNDELVELLTKDNDADEREIKALVQQVEHVPGMDLDGIGQEGESRIHCGRCGHGVSGPDGTLARRKGRNMGRCMALLLTSTVLMTGLLIGGAALAETFRGTDRDESFAGTNRPDEAYGRGGNDQLSGRGDSDELYSGAGRDRLDGGTARDELYAAEGSDPLVAGGEGNDYMVGGLGNDALVGGEGDDELFAEIGDDRLDGQGGDDDLYSGKGSDRIAGGDGQNEIFAGADNDTVLARDGRRDVVECGRDTDTVYFDTGTDQVQGDCERLNP